MARLVETEVEKTEKGFSSDVIRTPGETLAHWISLITSPFIVAIPLFGFVSLLFAPRLTTGLLWWMIICLGLAIPFLVIQYGVKQGRYSDIHVSIRSQRLVPMTLGLICIVAIFGCLLLLHASRELIATLTATLVSFLIAALITQIAKYKISFHISALTGAITVCYMLLGPPFLLLYLLVFLVGWARWKVEAHSPLQASSGAALALSITLATFWLFGLH